MKQAAKLMTIGRAASRSGVPAKTIRFYEDAGIIAPAARGANRYRAYSEADVQNLRFIARARSLGFSLKEVAELLSLYGDRRRASKDVKRVALAHVADLDRKITELREIRDTIADLARRCHGDKRPECPILEELEAPTAPGRSKPLRS
jgi:Cu(I)-responsive transcriptional regulator